MGKILKPDIKVSQSCLEYGQQPLIQLTKLWGKNRDCLLIKPYLQDFD